MTTVQQLFKQGKAFAEQENDLSKLVLFLDTLPSLFVSVAYEGAAMALAIKDVSEGNHLKTWRSFLESYGQHHAVQIHIGLGWALAQQRVSARSYLEEYKFLLPTRILDGYGYYDGFFRRRKTLQGVLPFGIKGDDLTAYSQGVGRSLWYTSKGKISKLMNLIEVLPLNRHKDLWRGVGVASTYVGGGEHSHWQHLWNEAGKYQAQLAAGAAMAIMSRVDANTTFEDSSVNTTLWCKMDVPELVSLCKKKYPSNLADHEQAYYRWVTEIDNVFANY